MDKELETLVSELIRQNEKMQALRREYDELLADCKDLLSGVNLIKNGISPEYLVQFNDPFGYPAAALKLLYEIFKEK